MVLVVLKFEIHVFWIFFWLCLCCDLSEFLAVFVVFNLWIVPGVIFESCIDPLKPELNPICYLLALLGAYHFLHVSRIRVKLLTFR